MKDAPTRNPLTCWWDVDDDGVYTTSCDYTFVFESEGPIENGFAFCPHCGKEIRALRVGQKSMTRLADRRPEDGQRVRVRTHGHSPEHDGEATYRAGDPDAFGRYGAWAVSVVLRGEVTTRYLTAGPDDLWVPAEEAGQ